MFQKFFDKHKSDGLTMSDTEGTATANETKSVDNTEYEGKIIDVNGRGFGFISCKEIPFTRVFFHWTGLRQNTLKFPALKKGMKVKFFKIIINHPVTKEEQIRAVRITVVTE
jgi:cold shock CspA family protein